MTVEARVLSDEGPDCPTGGPEKNLAPRFLGKQIVAVAFVGHFLANAVTMATVGNFMKPLSAAFAVDQSAIGLGLSLAILTLGVAGPFLGRWLDAGHARRMMGAGAAMTGFGLLLLSRTTTLGQFGVVFIGLVCVGSAFCGVIPSSVIIANWFVRRRGLALGLTVAGATVSSYVAPASAQYLIDAYGWRAAIATFGAATLVVAVPIFGLFAIGRPEDVGQRPDGGGTPEEATGVSGDGARSEHAGASADEMGTLETSALIRDSRLWLLAVGFGLVMTSPIVLIGYLVPFGESLGFTAQQANVFFLAMVPFSILGKIVVGGLADVAPIKPSILMVVVVNILVWIIFYTEPSYTVFLATGALYGIGIGGASPLHGVAVGLCFGRANFGRASGIAGMATVPLIAIASASSQMIRGETEGFSAGFLLQMGLLVLGGALLMSVPLPKRQSASA